ncbi:MAG: 6-phospho-beta-glucosidase [Christensenellaceae bacterium]|jgi:6-phospho-beta-glucosidase|nr:6-phospho-beta-glucosidase [Christensenellaceae bacterium]
MKLAVIGGCGVRSPLLAKSLAGRAQTLNISQIVFMDISTERLEVYGSLAMGIFRALAPSIKFSLTTDAALAITDADYVITTIRAGGDAMRARDERIALSHNVIGQETVGVAGFSFAMRSIPVLIEYCKKVRGLAKPHCKVFNFTNPAGLVSQALIDAGFDFTYGICDAPSGLLRQIAKLYNAKEIRGECFGLNHLSYFNSIVVDNLDITEHLLQDEHVLKNSDLRFFPKSLLTHKGTLPNEYLYYYYYPDIALSNILKCGKSRGEIIEVLTAEMTDALKNTNSFESALSVYSKHYARREHSYMTNETGIKCEKPFTFDLKSQEAGGYADVALKYIELSQSAKGGDMVLCVPNTNSIPGLEETDVVEVTCTVSSSGCMPHKFDNISTLDLDLIRRVKLYERLAVKAILQHDISVGIDALFANPLCGSFSIAEKLAKTYFELNCEYCDLGNYE